MAERLDQYLVRTGQAASRRVGRALIEEGKVRLNGGRPSKGQTVTEGDRIEVERSEAAAIEPNVNLQIEVLYEASAVLVVNKPALMPCHPLRAGERETLMNAVVARFPEVAQAGDKPREGGLVHRLDNGTSGAVIIARTRESFAALVAAIRSGAVQRCYEALVAGNIGERMELRQPIAHHPKNRRKMVVAHDAESAARLGARDAATIVDPLRALGSFTLVRVTPRTGSRHQIRVHLACAGFPLAGDQLYGGPQLESLAPGRFYLHLSEVRCDTPALGTVKARASRPADLEAALAEAASRRK